MKSVIFISIFFLVLNVHLISAQSDEEKKMLTLVNKLRQDRGLSTLRFSAALNKASKDHSKDMADNNYFSHVGLNNSQFWNRAKDAGYTGNPRAENIAAGGGSAEGAFNQWVNSSGHLSNMLLSDINEMGIGYAYNRNSDYRHYWTQMFGRGSTLSDEDIEQDVALSVFPNPVKNKLNIKFNNLLDDKIVIELISITGKTVFRKTKNNSKTAISLNIENLTSGVYFLKINNRNSLVKVISCNLY